MPGAADGESMCILMRIVALSVAMLLSGLPAVDSPAPIPDAAAQAASLKLVRDIFKADYASAKLAPAKLKLSKKLLEQGIETRDDPAARYVLFLEARDLAVEAGDAQSRGTAPRWYTQTATTPPMRRRRIALA